MTMKIIGVIIAFVVQKKSTPFKKPRNSGGSPRGVNEPPIFATKKMKNTIMWVLFFLNSLALIMGLINNIAAPVVPIQLAKTVPTKIINVTSKLAVTNEILNRAIDEFIRF